MALDNCKLHIGINLCRILEDAKLSLERVNNPNQYPYILNIDDIDIIITFNSVDNIATIKYIKDESIQCEQYDVYNFDYLIRTSRKKKKTSIDTFELLKSYYDIVKIDSNTGEIVNSMPLPNGDSNTRSLLSLLDNDFVKNVNENKTFPNFLFFLNVDKLLNECECVYSPDKRNITTYGDYIYRNPESNNKYLIKHYGPLVSIVYIPNYDADRKDYNSDRTYVTIGTLDKTRAIELTNSSFDYIDDFKSFLSIRRLDDYGEVYSVPSAGEYASYNFTQLLSEYLDYIIAKVNAGEIELTAIYNLDYYIALSKIINFDDDNLIKSLNELKEKIFDNNNVVFECESIKETLDLIRKKKLSE